MGWGLSLQRKGSCRALGREWQRVKLEEGVEVRSVSSSSSSVGYLVPCQQPYPPSSPGTYTLLKKHCQTKSLTQKDGLLCVNMWLKSRRISSFTHSVLQILPKCPSRARPVTGVGIQLHPPGAPPNHAQGERTLWGLLPCLLHQHCVQCSVESLVCVLTTNQWHFSIITTRPPGHQNAQLLKFQQLLTVHRTGSIS